MVGIAVDLENFIVGLSVWIVGSVRYSCTDNLQTIIKKHNRSIRRPDHRIGELISYLSNLYIRRYVLS